MAALKQPTSFKVVKLVEGNAASRSGQPGEGVGRREGIFTVQTFGIRTLGVEGRWKHTGAHSALVSGPG